MKGCVLLFPILVVGTALADLDEAGLVESVSPIPA